MCGIFGILAGKDSGVDAKALRPVLDQLFILSESRGKEASGLISRIGREIHTLKQPIPASKLILTRPYAVAFKNKAKTESVVLIGHSRLVTNGSALSNENNQPVAYGDVIGVHNGIIVNSGDIWTEHTDLERKTMLDSEAIMALADKFTATGKSPAEATAEVYSHIEGAASLALVFNKQDRVVLSTNTGSLYYLKADVPNLFVFASEAWILNQLLQDKKAKSLIGGGDVEHLKPFNGLLIDLGDLSASPITFSMSYEHVHGKPGRVVPPIKSFVAPLNLNVSSDHTGDSLRRCVKCILPETVPHIYFDEKGVCNFCNEYHPIMLKGRDALEEILAPIRSTDGSPDCVVGFSGGRDSSYGLHLLKNEFGMTPLAVTYDWGMVTDLARRNQARITGALGIEHVLVSANISAKRANIAKNVTAWLKKPELGMVPLFMAGDKQFFYHAEDQCKKGGFNTNIMCVNPLEYTYFKTGFAGISNVKYYNEGMSKYRLLAYYAREILTNPAYINRSLFDTALAYLSTYVIKHNYLMLFDYVPWDEDEVNSVLIKGYDWEIAPDTISTWRIGDGTASFYNYIYAKVAGFSENDTFRSNQIREGIITRDQAMALVMEENKPRWDSIREYLELIGVDFNYAIGVIESIPTLPLQS